MAQKPIFLDSVCLYAVYSTHDPLWFGASFVGQDLASLMVCSDPFLVND